MKHLSVYLIIVIALVSCSEDIEPIPEEPLGRVRLSLIGDKEIVGEILTINILDNSGSVLKSINSISAPPSEFIELDEGSYRISISSQNQEFSNFGDLVFNGISDLFDISRSETLEISVNLIFDEPLGQVKIELSGLDTDNETFSLISLDADSTVVATEENLLEISDYLALEDGTYQYAIQSTLRNYNTVDDLVFSGYSAEFSIAKGDTLLLDINIGLDDRKGWVRIPNVPIGERFAAASFIIENNIYIGFGSSFSNERFQDWWVYSIDDNTWERLADFPDGRRFASLSFSIGSKGYICLGYDENATQLSELWEFDPATESWAQLNDFPGVGRSSGAVFVIDNRAYVGSGIANGVNPLGDFYSFDQSNNEWNQISNFIGDPTYGFTSFAIGDVGYLVGGVTNTTGEIGQDVRTRQYAEYNSSNQTWAELSPFPGDERLEAVGFSIGGNGYFGLGSIDNNTAGTDFWVYNPTDGTWQETDSFIAEPRFSTIHGSNDSVGYFGFGQKGNSQYNDLYLFYPSK